MRTHISRHVLQFDPTSDVLFKYIFEVSHTLIPFLNSILHLPKDHHIKDITYLGHEGGVQHDQHRGIIFDLRVCDQQGKMYNLEIQKSNDPAFLLRGLYYGTRIISKQLIKNQSFLNLKPTHVVLLTLFDLYPDEQSSRVFWMTPYELSTQTKNLNTDEMKDFLLSNHPDGFDAHHAQHHQTKSAFTRKLDYSARLNEILRIYLIELSKVKPDVKTSADVDVEASNYLQFLTWGHESSKLYAKEKEDEMKSSQEIEIPKEWVNNPWIQECLSRMEKFSNDPQKVQQYEAAEKALLIYNTQIELSREEGIEIGIERGIEQGIEQGIKYLVQTQHKNGSNLESIAQFNGLSLKKVRQLLELND